MSDKINALTVVFKEPLDIDETRRVIDAILMLYPVLSVRQEVADVNTYAALERARREIWRKIVEAMGE